MATQTTVESLRREIADLEHTEVHVETNQGTYSAVQAHAKMGCGDPRFANREVYETVAGARRETGPGPDRYPGYMRPIGRRELADLRKRLADLRRQLRQSR